MDANQRTKETCVSIPFYQSLVSGIAAALCLGVGTLGIQWAIGDRVSWLATAIAAVIAFCAGFALVWALLLWSLWPRVQQSVTRTQAPPEVLPLTPIEFGAHGARAFVNDSLWRVDGAWQDKTGGCSFRAMARKGYSRDRWEQGVAWLMDHGLLRWKSDKDHRQGLEWDLERVSRFMGV